MLQYRHITGSTPRDEVGQHAEGQMFGEGEPNARDQDAPSAVRCESNQRVRLTTNEIA